MKRSAESSQAPPALNIAIQPEALLFLQDSSYLDEAITLHPDNEAIAEVADHAGIASPIDITITTSGSAIAFNMSNLPANKETPNSVVTKTPPEAFHTKESAELYMHLALVSGINKLSDDGSWPQKMQFDSARIRDKVNAVHVGSLVGGVVLSNTIIEAAASQSPGLLRFLACATIGSITGATARRITRNIKHKGIKYIDGYPSLLRIYKSTSAK